MRLEDIGFYTLSDARVKQASWKSPLWRCELILTGRCNYRCPHCRGIGGEDLPFSSALNTLNLWIQDGLKNIRFSGGEPTMYLQLPLLVKIAAQGGIKRIALSTNGSAPWEIYRDLWRSGVNDFSISLDACCAEDARHMSGGRDVFRLVEENIRALSELTYVTVGVVLTPDNAKKVHDIVVYADSLGVSDIRVIPAAQHGQRLPHIDLPEHLLEKYSILRYRINKFNRGESVRGLSPQDSKRCGLVLDDMAVMGDKHYPCIIHMREGGDPIGKVGPDMRRERWTWSLDHDCTKDPICSQNCPDVCCDYNRRFQEE